MISVSKVEHAARLRLTGGLHGEICDKQELICVESGAVIISMDGEGCLVNAGEGLFCRPHCHLTFQPQKEAEVIVLSFCCDSPTLQKLEQRIVPVDRLHISAICHEADSEQFGSRQMVKNILEQVLILSVRHGGIHCRERAVSANPLQQHAWTVHQVRDYLHGHYSQRITLELLATRYDISVTQLKRIFKEQTGTTIISYLTDYRIERAKELIRSSSMSFTQIAEAVGYDNIYYFSTQFKKQTGMTPTEYSRTKN